MIYVTFMIEKETTLLTEKEHNKVIPLAGAVMGTMPVMTDEAIVVTWKGNVAVNWR